MESKGKRKPKFPKSGLSLEYLKDMLKTASTPISYSDYWRNCMTNHKHTFIKYLDWLLLKGYVNKKIGLTDSPTGRFHDMRTQKCMLYHTTELGQKFLEMIS